MNISGIRPAIGFYDYNSIKVQPEAVSNQKESDLAVADVKPQISVSVTDEDIRAARQRQTFGSLDYASQYQPDEVYEMKGVDSDIKSLDVERAISDMQKDSVIQQYQFFVGDTGISPTEEPSIRGAENFVL